jgi:diphthamide biosynthesis methyltransferase
MVESASDEILEDAQNVDVAFLVVGDPFGYVFLDIPQGYVGC